MNSLSGSEDARSRSSCGPQLENEQSSIDAISLQECAAEYADRYQHVRSENGDPATLDISGSRKCVRQEGTTPTHFSQDNALTAAMKERWPRKMGKRGLHSWSVKLEHKTKVAIEALFVELSNSILKSEEKACLEYHTQLSLRLNHSDK